MLAKHTQVAREARPAAMVSMIIRRAAALQAYGGSPNGPPPLQR
jgi:hypothetical protein